MDIKVISNDNELTLKLDGALDTNTSPLLEATLKDVASQSFEKLVFDFSDLKYLSSAGLRILLACHKRMMASGRQMIIRNANSEIVNIFNMTGMSMIFNLE